MGCHARTEPRTGNDVAEQRFKWSSSLVGRAVSDRKVAMIHNESWIEQWPRKISANQIRCTHRSVVPRGDICFEQRITVTSLFDTRTRKEKRLVQSGNENVVSRDYDHNIIRFKKISHALTGNTIQNVGSQAAIAERKSKEDSSRLSSTLRSS